LDFLLWGEPGRVFAGGCEWGSEVRGARCGCEVRVRGGGCGVRLRLRVRGVRGTGFFKTGRIKLLSDW
jgi:hypothetical protein